MTKRAGGVSEERLLQELRALAEQYPDVRMMSGRDSPTFEGSWTVDGEERHARLSLPPGYPAVPPVLWELSEPRGRPVPSGGRMHRFQDGSLCLFPHGNDTQAWNPSLLAADALDRFIAFVKTERERAGLSQSRVYPDDWQIWIPEGMARTMLLPGGRGRLDLICAATMMGDRYACAIDFAGIIPAFEAQGVEHWKAILQGRLAVPWVYADFNGRPWEDILKSRAEFTEELRRALPESIFRGISAEETIVLVREDSESSEVDALHVYRPCEDVGVLRFRSVGIGETRERLFQRVDGVLPERGALSAVRIVLVGVGSLGGAVALALARAGVSDFVLIDPDVLSVENICRHVGSLPQVGRYKVGVVAELIRGINPEVKIEAVPQYLSWDLREFGAGARLEELLDDSKRDVIVATCAIGETERQLNNLAVRRGVPVIFGSALGAAAHGRIFRVIPGETACYECVLLAQERDPAEYPRFVLDDRVSRERVPYVHQGLPGMAIDITQIAMIIARLTLQTLGRILGVDLGVRDEGGDHLLWSNRGEWGPCDRALQVVVHRVPQAKECPVCGVQDEGGLSEEDAEELTALRERLRASSSHGGEC